MVGLRESAFVLDPLDLSDATTIKFLPCWQLSNAGFRVEGLLHVSDAGTLGLEDSELLTWTQKARRHFCQKSMKPVSF